MTFFYRLIESLAKQYILHPFLVIIYFIFHYLITFEGVINWYELLGIFFTLFLGYFIAKLIIQKIILDKFNASYLLSFVLVFFLFYEDIHYTVSLLLSFQIRNRYFLPIILSATLLFLLFLLRSKRIYRLNLFLNILIIVYLIIDLTSYTVLKFESKSFTENQKLTTKLNVEHLPNVFLLLIDGYGNNNNLERYYHFNNNKFIDSLNKIGFHVVQNAKSNYCFTVLTMSSMLNLRYHTPQQRNFMPEIMELIKKNIVTELLEQRGYEINNLSIFNIQNFNAKYGLKIWTNRSSLPFYYLTKTSIFVFLTQKEKGEGLSRELKVFQAVDSLCSVENQKPKFVYAHVLLPHVPFYLDDLGHYQQKIDDRNPSLSSIKDLVDKDPNNNTMGSSEADSLLKIDYISHIKYTNKKCLETITNILKYGKRPSIIILMSDHGSRMLTNPIPHSEAVKERYDNFCAIYYPNKDYSKLYDSITPINVMRQVLNKSINTKYYNLKDISGLEIE